VRRKWSTTIEISKRGVKFVAGRRKLAVGSEGEKYMQLTAEGTIFLEAGGKVQNSRAYKEGTKQISNRKEKRTTFSEKVGRLAS
jgi:hypothetical protein